ncbi:GNAT family N-acetyltransferase [Vibrio crassostreae]|uniref:GNAT family N-acetyltransferase n=1 Tax=Vibrio crassostreae TaxID=246167 RepID=UPI000633B3CD|nr:GNAT family N-acetyltransferase [Vibrio crassostreae]TCT47651.1 putative acetyltransferase [Vibrio crassostreae]TCT61879.1 putative acetyltransferase [Vibrio crassostreae]TCT72581.1 putative acetyltransferase [Vibrio crassostreae]TCT92717.1 putative acetyltransferase [Vibrio crassostreae]CAK1785283.1 GNAT family N-acetyltransferase [Vibrio crassostreae]
MLDIKKITTLSDLSELKTAYFADSTAPLDDMWHFGFVPMSDHYGFYENDKLVGYCVLNGEGYLLQFFLAPTASANIADLFILIIENNSSVIGDVKGAFVSTAEPQYLSLCMDNTCSFKVNSLMYRQDQETNSSRNSNRIEDIEMTLATEEQLDKLVEFASSAIGAPKEWLTGYYGNLIARQELWGYWESESVLATGECRKFDEHQTQFADLGMIVAQAERGKGLATRVLNFLTQHANSQGLEAMCSTESSNIGAKKAITRAGLSSKHRILQFDFSELKETD